MGSLGPVCKTHQPFKRHLTKNQEPARKVSDVIGHVLACDHQVGGEKFNKFQEELRELEKAKAERFLEIEQKHSDKITAIWEKLNSSNDKGGSS